MKNYTYYIYSLIAGFMMLFATEAGAQSWDFSEEGVGTEDETNLNADTQNWVYDATNNRWGNVPAYEVAPLLANGVEVNFTKGLLFTTVADNGVRLDNKKRCLTLNKANSVITIKNLKKDDKVQVRCKTSSKTEARGLNVTNITPVSGFFNQTTKEDQVNVGTVTENGDITLTNTGGIYIYEISVGEAGGGDTPVPDNYNSVSLNPNKNQIRLTLTNSDIKYYNTEDITVAIDKVAGTVTVNPINGDWSDVFTNTVSGINFAKAQATGSEGEIVNGGIEITEAKGWLESAYVKWAPYTGASSYNVYVKGGQYSDWTKIDNQLVRDYGTYVRADVVGLKADNNYALKVVPVISDAEKTDAASSAANINVANYDRSGYAHFNTTAGVGAYNNDGTLKSGAVVLYVTKDNFNTIECEVTVGNNKKEKRVGLGQILQAFEKCAETRPFAIRFIGQVTAADNQLLGEKKSLQLKGKAETSAMNVTFEGIGDDATWYGWGMTLNKCASVEVRNIATMLFNDDGIQLKECDHIWIHNNDIFYGGTGSDSDQAKGDGSLDTKDSGTYNTFSYNHFWDSGKCSLCGMKSENTDDYETYHHNWFDHSDSRHPRVRTKTVHVYNNYYDGVSKYGVGATMGSSVFVENNYFRASKNPMLISKQGRDAQGNGTFSGEAGGMIKSFGNLYTEKGSVGSYTPITQKESATSFDCYEAASRDEKVPSSFKTLAGGTTYNNFDTNSSQIYSYTPDATGDVPTNVTGFYGAGRLNHGDFQWTFDNKTQDTNYDVIKELKSALEAYKTSLVKVYGDINAGSGETGGDTPTPDPDPNPDPDPTPDPSNVVVAGTTVTFDSFTSGSNIGGFTITANKKSGANPVTYNGKTYTTAIKVESGTKTSISFTTETTLTVKLVTDATSGNLLFDGTAVAIGTDGVASATLEAGAHTIVKGSGSPNLYAIIVE